MLNNSKKHTSGSVERRLKGILYFASLCFLESLDDWSPLLLKQFSVVQLFQMVRSYFQPLAACCSWRLKWDSTVNLFFSSKPWSTYTNTQTLTLGEWVFFLVSLYYEGFPFHPLGQMPIKRTSLRIKKRNLLQKLVMITRFYLQH